MTQADATPVRTPSPAPLRMEQLHRQWEGLRTPGANHDLWIFGYGSLIWRPEFDYAEHHPVRIHGWHRALKMWSHLYRGTPTCPGLVFALLPGGSCQGVVFRVPRRDAPEVLRRVWEREMVTNIYTPRWLRCATPGGEQHALTFTLSRRSPSYAGTLSEARYREIFGNACGCYGSTLDYARQTHEALCRHGIRDRALHRLLALAGH